MTEEELNRTYIRERLKDYDMSLKLLNEILNLCSEQYKNGLIQGHYDKEMDMIQKKREILDFIEDCENRKNRLNEDEIDVLKRIINNEYECEDW